MQPELTILLVADVEHDRVMDRRWFGAVRELNPRAHDRLQVIVLNQRPDRAGLEELAAAQPYPVEIADCDYPRDESGYPVWDLVAAVREVWGRVEAPYVTFSHMEYLHGPDRLARTCDWLAEHQPTIALGNLRRITAKEERATARTEDSPEPLDAAAKDLVDRDRWDLLAEHWTLFGGRPWVYWVQPPANCTRWLEDVFFASRDWLDAMRFWDHGGPQPFQDVYDLVGAAMWRMEKLGIAPECRQMARSVHDACHLSHHKHWRSYTPAMRAWFVAHASEYAGTTFVRGDLWDAVFAGGPNKSAAVNAFRREPGGTVARWLADFSRYLSELGFVPSPISQYAIC